MIAKWPGTVQTYSYSPSSVGAVSLSDTFFAAKESNSGWTAMNLDGTPAAQWPWALQERGCVDGQKAQIISSFPHGEQLTGVLRSAPFALDGTLRFYLCGHDGEPSKPAGKKNFDRLRDAANGAVLHEAAQRIEWPLEEFKGRSGYLEITDGDTGSANTLLVFGRFKTDIAERRETEASLMPPTFGEAISASELSDLLAYLFSKCPGK